jgi:hypothetical protein
MKCDICLTLTKDYCDVRKAENHYGAFGTYAVRPVTRTLLPLKLQALYFIILILPAHRRQPLTLCQ